MRAAHAARVSANNAARRRRYRDAHPEAKREQDNSYYQRHRAEINRKRRIRYAEQHGRDTW
jgi:hypothetical protein